MRGETEPIAFGPHDEITKEEFRLARQTVARSHQKMEKSDDKAVLKGELLHHTTEGFSRFFGDGEWVMKWIHLEGKRLMLYKEAGSIEHQSSIDLEHGRVFCFPTGQVVRRVINDASEEVHVFQITVNKDNIVSDSVFGTTSAANMWSWIKAIIKLVHRYGTDMREPPERKVVLDSLGGGYMRRTDSRVKSSPMVSPTTDRQDVNSGRNSPYSIYATQPNRSVRSATAASTVAPKSRSERIVSVGLTEPKPMMQSQSPASPAMSRLKSLTRNPHKRVGQTHVISTAAFKQHRDTTSAHRSELVLKLESAIERLEDDLGKSMSSSTSSNQYDHDGLDLTPAQLLDRSMDASRPKSVDLPSESHHLPQVADAFDSTACSAPCIPTPLEQRTSKPKRTVCFSEDSDNMCTDHSHLPLSPHLTDHDVTPLRDSSPMADLKKIKNLVSQLHPLTVTGKNSNDELTRLRKKCARQSHYIERMKQENLSLRQKYFFTLAMAVKLENENIGKHSNTPVQTLWERAQVAHVNYSDWPEWIQKQFAESDSS